MSHHLLLQRAMQGDFKARDELVMEHYPALRQRLTDDEAHDALMVALRKLPEFRGESSVGTWIYGIGQFVVLGARRREQRRIRGIGGDADPLADVPSKLPGPEEVLMRKER